MAKIKKQLLTSNKKSKVIKKGTKKNVIAKGPLKSKLKKQALKRLETPDSDSEVEDLLNKDELSEEENDNMEAQNSNSESEEELDEEALAEKHKRDLEKLKETDPEFYKFLQENDKKLLQFSVLDEDNADQSDDQEDEDQEEVHKPSGDLEVASDESDYEPEDDEEKQKDDRVITLKMIKQWQSDIQTDKSNKTITKLTQAFHAALKRVASNEEDQDDEPVHFKVEGSAVFNGVVQLCVMELGPAIRRFLGIQQGSKQPPHKCKKFNKIKRTLKGYFTDILKLLVGVTSSNIQTVLLKHLHYMAPMLNSYTNITKSILHKLIKIWGTADDSVRVLAFLCIVRIIHNQMGGTLDTCLKSMYMTYVQNSKFVSINTLATINFIKRSLVEIFALDLNVAYSHVFLYIRQLAIHLRNAITMNKKENIQSVYNWQFVNSLRLWGTLLSVTYSKPQMQQLVYPFVQVCLGTLKLVPTAQYYPLRFHILQILIEFSKDTGVFVPILPFLLEVLTSHDFNKKHQKVSMKPLHFTCILRLSKSQMQENGFKDAVIDNIYAQLLEYLSTVSHSISFPDLSLVCILQIKQFLKKCKMANYSRKLKQALEKIEQNAQFIENERSKLTLHLTDLKQIDGWESQIKTKGTPLSTFYESFSKVRNMKKNREVTNSDALGDYKLPKLKKPDKKITKSDGPVELFPSDSEDDETEIEKKPKRGKRGGKNVKKNRMVNMDDGDDVDDSGDIVKEISMDDW